jgi:hypothetical protein
MTIAPISVPDDWDDNGILLFEEFCAFIRTPQRTVREMASPQARAALVALQRQRPPLYDRRRVPPFPQGG